MRVIHFIGHLSSKYGRNKGDKDLKQRVKRNSMIAAGVGTAAGLGIGAYAVYKSKQPYKGTIVMPKVDKPLSHLKPDVSGLLKEYEEKFDVAAQIHKNLKTNTGKVGNNTGGWLLRKPRANLKVKSQRRGINTDKVEIKINAKTEADVQKKLDKYTNDFKGRIPTVKIGKNSGQNPKKFRFKSQ